MSPTQSAISNVHNDSETLPPRHARGSFVATVSGNLPLCREHFKLILRLDSFPPTAPGQFIQLACRDWDADYIAEREFDWAPGGMVIACEANADADARAQTDAQVHADDGPHAAAFVESGVVFGDELLAPLALLRRPFSLAGRRDLPGGAVELEVIHRIVGTGTAWLAQLKPTDRVHLLGPLGNRFTLPAPGVEALLVGGGVGIPPMLYLAEALGAIAKGDAVRNSTAVAFAGALSGDLLPLSIDDAKLPSDPARTPANLIGEFARHGIPSIVATDDGSLGYRGFVTGALEAYLDANPRPPNERIIYTCGPEPMMQRVAAIALQRGIPCEVAVERAMACGMGTCQSCCIRVKSPNDPAGRPWVYRLACTDGPIFSAADLLW